MALLNVNDYMLTLHRKEISVMISAKTGLVKPCNLQEASLRIEVTLK